MAKPAPKRLDEPASLTNCDKFVRIKNVTRKTDNFEAFQPEVLWLDGDTIVKRELISKPDMFEMAFAIAGDLVDPRNV